MNKKKEKLAYIALIIATIITLINSIRHHIILAEFYGEIANLFVPTIAISSFLLGAVISLLFQWGINIIQFEHIARLLPSNEERILKVLFSKQKITQSDLSIETGLSAVVVSRVISALERKGVIIKKPMKDTNLIVSKLHKMHYSTKILTKFPGISEKRILIVISLVFIFGISLSVLNSFHIDIIGHPLEIELYLIAIEFFALGGLTNLILRKKISSIQFNRLLSILPEDEREVLKEIYSEKKITQKELVDKTGIYKMKISRVLKKFEDKGIIERRPYGYTNIVTLKI
ncbi:MAG: winged helix-turn-helix transcriptional regulator [Candidatus Altiarchaeota archaeon]